MSDPTRTIVFSHANGYPSGVYRVLFERWRAAGWRVEALDKFGHDPAYPVTSNWPHLRDQLLAFIDGLGDTGGPVHLVGHSLGGFLSLIAACRRPTAFASVTMLDSPVVAGWRAHSVQVAKATRLIHRVSPGKVSRHRRNHWPDRAAAHAHYASKHLFQRWDPRVLADYIAFGIVDDPEGGVRLAFTRETETRIYDTLPHVLPALIRRHRPACPVRFIAGTQSAEIRQVGLAATKALTRGQLEWIEGSHLYPMERPEETADRVLTLLQAPPTPSV